MNDRHRSCFVVALLTGVSLFVTTNGFAGSNRQRRCQVYCPPCVGNSGAVAAPTTAASDSAVVAPMPAASPKPKSKRTLPEGVTEVTPEHLVGKIPNFFYYDYNFDPEPGKRVWIRTNDNLFLERYPSGKENAFEVLGRATAEQLEGTIAIRIEPMDQAASGATPKLFRVFIADKTLETRRIYFDHPDYNSGKWVYLGEMKSVE